MPKTVTEVTTLWVNYTPNKARMLLKKNTRNRKPRQYVIEDYARDMAAGQWLPTGDTIKVSTEGELLDGQHRLHAVIVAWRDLGCTEPIGMLTVRGLPPDSQGVIDTGVPRTAGDALQLSGLTNAATVAAAAKAVIRLEDGSIFDHSPGAGRVTHSEIMTWISSQPEFLPFIEDHLWRTRRTKIPTSAVLAAMWTLWKIDKAAADTFLDKLIELDDLPSGSAILALHRNVQDLKTKRSRLTPEEWIGRLFYAWNRWRAGTNTPYLRTPKGGFGTQETFPWPQELVDIKEKES